MSYSLNTAASQPWAITPHSAGAHVPNVLTNLLVSQVRKALHEAHKRAQVREIQSPTRPDGLLFTLLLIKYTIYLNT
jgi:hypothetical protein